MADSFEKKSAFDAILTGSGREPVSTSLSTLDSYHALLQLEKLGGEDMKKSDIYAAYKNEVGFLKAGVKAVQENPLLQQMFGSGLAGAMQVAAHLHQIKTEEAAKNILVGYLPPGDTIGERLAKAGGVKNGTV